VFGTNLRRKNMDAITLLKKDHRTVGVLFRKYEAAGKNAIHEKQSLADQIIKELSVHTSIEEQLFYPAVRELSESFNEKVLEALEEHHGAKATLAELRNMTPEDERFDPKMTVLIESVRHHVEEEEKDLFPKVRKAMNREALLALGEGLEEAKSVAPNVPDPMAPDTPPANLGSNHIGVVLDSAKEMVRGSQKRVSAQR
jgi:hemerythrin superfamily protein